MADGKVCTRCGAVVRHEHLRLGKDWWYRCPSCGMRQYPSVISDDYDSYWEDEDGEA